MIYDIIHVWYHDDTNCLYCIYVIIVYTISYIYDIIYRIVYMIQNCIQNCIYDIIHVWYHDDTQCLYRIYDIIKCEYTVYLTPCQRILSWLLCSYIGGWENAFEFLIFWYQSEFWSQSLAWQVRDSWLGVGLAEFVFTFVLAYVVLATGRNKKKRKNKQIKKVVN